MVACRDEGHIGHRFPERALTDRWPPFCRVMYGIPGRQIHLSCAQLVQSSVCCSRLVHYSLFAPALAVLSALIGWRNRGMYSGYLSRIDVLSSVSL